MKLKSTAINIVNYLVVPIFFLVFLSSFLESDDLNKINIEHKNNYIIILLALISNILNNLKIYYELKNQVRVINFLSTMCSASCIAIILPLVGGYWKYRYLKKNSVDILKTSKIFFKVTLLSIIVKVVIDILIILENKFLLTATILTILILISLKLMNLQKYILYILSGCVDFIFFYVICISLNNELNNRNIAILDILSLSNLFSKYTPINFGVQEFIMGYYTKNLDFSFALGVNIAIIIKLSILLTGLVFFTVYIYDKFYKK